MKLDRIYHEDCLDGMKRIPDGSVDMILTDPPYGTTNNQWDRRLPFEPLWAQYLRICKENAAIVLFGQNPFAAELIMSQPKLFRYEWIWEKPIAVGFFNANKMPLRAHEMILVFYRRLPTYNPQWGKGKPYRMMQARSLGGCYNFGAPRVETISDGRRYPRDVLKGHVMRGFGFNTVHPTQKPVEILEYLIRTYTNEGELVLDNCMGSGSTAVACINTNRHYIGYETEAEYVEIAKQRIEEANECLIGQRNMQNLFSGDESRWGEQNIYAVKGT